MELNTRARLSRATTRYLAANLAVLLALALGVGCFDLEVTNPNTLDVDRAYLSPVSSEASVVGGWKVGAGTMQGRTAAGTCPSLPLAAWANELTGTATLNNGLDPMIYTAEPRVALDNTNVQNCVTRFAWYEPYSAMAAAREAYQGIVKYGHRYGDTLVVKTGADTPRLKIFAKFIMAMHLIRIGLLYDQGFVTDTTTNPQLPQELRPYKDVIAAGVAQMRNVIADARATADFTTPATWVNQNPISRDELIRIGLSWIVRAEVYAPRSAAERTAVNWTSVLARLDSTISRDFTEKADPLVAGTSGAYLNLSFANNTVRINNRFLGPADTSGEYQKWLGKTTATRSAFVISTPDRRIHAAGNASAAGTRFARQTTVMGNLSAVGDYLGSWYRGIKYLNAAADSGARAFVPYMTVDEMKFIRAEALFNLGRKAEAAALINPSRVAAGLKPVDANGPPNDASCVPRKLDGTCGDLFAAIKYEKRMELFPMLAEVSYFDTRGWGELLPGTPIHLPPSGRDMASAGIAIYTFGGGGPGSAP